MNRGRSSDSLVNSDAEPDWASSSGSSSPLDFTSDDETNPDKLYLMSGQPPKITRSRASNKTKNQAGNYQRSAHLEYPLQAQRPILGSNQHHLIDGCHVDRSLNASTSYYKESSALPSDSLSSRIPDVLPISPVALIPDQSFGFRCNNQIDHVNSGRSMMRNRRNNVQRGAHSSSSSMGVHEDNENFSVDQEDLYNRRDNTAPIALPGIPGSSSLRSNSSHAIVICARLMEMRSVLDCVEFVENNRDIIDDLTRIITHEAPAFRDYDMSQYQTDYSVKDSFNPSFWLDREPVITTADGNCQYHAVSLGLTGSESYTPEVRLATAVAVIDNREWFDSMLKLIDRGSILDLVRTIARSYSWGDETTLKAIAVAINRRIFLYTCNIGKKDYEMVRSLSKEELLDAFKEKKYRGGTGIHTYADPLIHVPPNNYIMLFHKSEHFIAVLPTTQQPTMFEPYNPIVPLFD